MDKPASPGGPWTFLQSPRIKWALLLLFALVALTLRIWDLNEKPMHHDEAVFGWFVIQMWHQGFYRYDPTNYHGPLFFYLLQISEWLFGRGLWSIRVVPAFFSALTCVFFAWLGLFRKSIWGLGALVLLLSPAAQFFGRSGIQEGLVAFSEILILYFTREWLMQIPSAEDLKAARKKKITLPGTNPTLLLLFFTIFAIEFSLKETAAIFVISFGAAAVILGALTRFSGWSTQWHENRATIFKGIGIFALIIFLLFSGFFQNMGGVIDFVAAYLPWLKTGVAGSSGHEKPFYYWSNLIWENERATLLMALAPLFFWGSLRKVSRFVVLTAWIQFVVYSIVPYKTPWCLLTMQGPLIFAFLCAVQDFPKNFRWGTSAIVGILALVSTGLMYDLSLRSPILMDHSYVYVQGAYEYKKMDEFFHQNRDVIGDRPLAVAFSDFWPLPYSFVDFNLQYFTPQNPPDAHFDVLFFDSTEKARMESVLGEGFVSKDFMIRGARGPGVVFIRRDLFSQMTGRWD